MKLLYLLESIRNPVFDFFFSTITHIGEETFFLVLAILFFWCVNKREGYYILTVGLVGTVINQGLKLACRIDRPWVKDPSFHPVESAVPEATGYSFPSGHTQNAAGTFGSIALFARRNAMRIASVVIIALVSFSRMYLGVHTPLDVAVSLAVAAVLVFGLYPVFSSEGRFERFMPFVISGAVLLSVALAVYSFTVDPTGIDGANHASAMKNSATLLGCMAGLLLVYPIDRFVTKFETGGKWYAQVIKLALGLLVVLGIKSGLKSPLEALFGNVYVARGIRYFLIVAFAGAVYPAFFKFFAKMRISFLDKLAEKITGSKKKVDTDATFTE